MSVYKSRPSPAPPNSKWDQIWPFWAKNPNSGGADEGCVVLRVRVAALHRAVRE